MSAGLPFYSFDSLPSLRVDPRLTKNFPKQGFPDVTLVGIGDVKLQSALDHELMLGSRIWTFEPMLAQLPDEFSPFKRLRHA